MPRGGNAAVCAIILPERSRYMYTIVFKVEGSADVKVQAEQGENLL